MDKIKNKIEIFLALVLLAGLGVFGYFKVMAYLDVYQYNEDIQVSVIKAQEDISDLEGSVTEAKLVFQETNTAKSEEVAGVFPDGEDLNSLTRAFDEFAVENNFSNNPFFISSISYQESVDSEDSQYMVLPFSMKVESSEDNFYKFLEYIETSGSLDNQIRLMAIDNVSISLGGEDDVLSYSLELNAYFQK